MDRVDYSGNKIREFIVNGSVVKKEIKRIDYIGTKTKELFIDDRGTIMEREVKRNDYNGNKIKERIVKGNVVEKTI